MVREIRDKNLFKRILSAAEELGLKTILTYSFLVVLVVGVGLTFIQTQRRQTISQQAAPLQSNPNRISYLGRDWYLHGANVPWYNWACDFGCNQNGGVSGNTSVLSSGFQKLKDANMHLARWWVFPGNPWQITKDQNGHPNGLDSKIYADFDAALTLANQYDVYYNFVLFSSATDLPSAWLTDPIQRTKLAQILGVLFARYKDNPRVMSWEIFNEPEFQIWNNQIAQAPVVDTVRAISDSVHTNSDALTTVGGAMLDGLPMWKDTGLDYYSPHWYDYMGSGGWCARCTDYNEVKNRFGLTRPVVIGELYIGTDTDSLQRFNDFYNKGYAGAWPWSLFPERTNDKLGIDFAAAKSFSITKTDIGPLSIGATITVAPTPTIVTIAPTTTPTIPPTPSPTNTPTPTPTKTPTPLPPTPTPTNTPTPIPSPTSSPVPPTPTPTKTAAQRADFNNSGKVEIQDLSYLLTRWGTNDTVADLNGDGKISTFDLSILLSNWGK